MTIQKNPDIKNSKFRSDKLRKRNGKHIKSLRTLCYDNAERLYKSSGWDAMPELRNGKLASLINWESLRILRVRDIRFTKIPSPAH